MIKAVLFDLDGVLIDAGPWHYAALNTALQQHGYTPISLDEHKHEFDGLPTKVKLARLIERGIVRSEDVDSIRAVKQKETTRLIEEKAKFDPGIYCLILGLLNQDYRVGVVSNAVSETCWRVLNHLKIGFSQIVVTANGDAPPKPSPEIYRVAASRARVDPGECLAIEDGHYGIESAIKAGCRVLEVSGPWMVTPTLVWRAMQ